MNPFRRDALEIGLYSQKGLIPSLWASQRETPMSLS